VQYRNICCFAAFWGAYYLVAPVSYIGLTHANLLKALGNNDKVSNLPAAVYLWLTVVPVLAAWFFPHPRHLKPMGLISVALMAGVTAAVALALWADASPEVATAVVIAHGAVFGVANGVLLTAMWDALKRGSSTSRRGPALALAFGAGPLLACVGSLFQDALFDGRLLGGRSFGLAFPDSYTVMFAVVAPLLLLVGVVLALFTLPDTHEPAAEPARPLDEITSGLRQFLHHRPVLFAVVIYVVVYSGGNAIFSNVSLHAKDVLGEGADTLGAQNFLRFGVKAAAGALLGWLLAATSPRAALLATTSILLVGMGWALNSRGAWFLATFGLLGAGELFGVYFPNYVTTASEKKFVRVNMAYLNVLSAVVGFSALAFGAISDEYGRVASFYVAAGLLALALVLTCGLLPADPSPRGDHSDSEARGPF
jgi:MFS family permease